jgi:5S rRNA maturation endonuclease (ribonuclease M5)
VNQKISPPGANRGAEENSVAGSFSNPTLSHAYDRILDHLRARGKKVRETRSGQASAQCPAHDDHNPSLSITRIEGSALVYCHSGCNNGDIMSALDLSLSDLFDNQHEAVYRYDDGRRVRRWYDDAGAKQFSQFGTKNPTSVLYRLHKIKAADIGTTIFLVEGEKDVHALEAIGAIATSAPQGAQSFSKVDPSPLYGRDVVAIVDSDDQGRKWARQVREALDGNVKSIKLVHAKTGKDAADHIAAGHALDEFQPTEGDEAAANRRARITWASDIEPEPVVWAWEINGEGRIPAGSLSIAAGREGTGKSSFGIWLSAQITKGELPGSFSGRARRVLYVAIEDSWKYTLVPRLIAAGADRSKIGRFEVITIEGDEVTLSLPSDNSLLEAEIRRHDVGIVVIDPVMSTIGEKIDTHITRDVRLVLDPLVRMADRTGAVVLGIAHFNKGTGTDAATLLSGSHAFRDVPRSLFGFARDDAEGIRVMTQVKNSLGRDDLPSLSYTITTEVIDTPKGIAETGKFTFMGESDRSVADVLRDGRVDHDDRQDRREIDEWLSEYLEKSEDNSADSKEVIRVGKGLGYTEDQIKKARRRIKAHSQRHGFGPGSSVVWSINATDATDAAPAPKAPMAPVGVTCLSCERPIDLPNPRCSLAAYHGSDEVPTL